MYIMEVAFGSYKFRVEILIMIVVVFWIMFGHLLCSCCLVSFKEGMAVLTTAATKRGSRKLGFTNMTFEPEFASSKSSDTIMPSSSWSMPTLVYSPGATPSAGAKSIYDRKKQPVPLPEGEMDMFATTEFKPSCCPNAYSTSTGCACMTVDQYKWIKNRGGNNVPYSEY